MYIYSLSGWQRIHFVVWSETFLKHIVRHNISLFCFYPSLKKSKLLVITSADTPSKHYWKMQVHIKECIYWYADRLLIQLCFWEELRVKVYNVKFFGNCYHLIIESMNCRRTWNCIIHQKDMFFSRRFFKQ